MNAPTIPARLLEQATLRPDTAAYYVSEGGTWVPTPWKDYVAQVRQASRALIALGVSPGDTVCILGFNRPEWVIFDVAAMAVGAVPAGIYTTCSATEVQYIIDHAEAGVVLLEDQGQWEKVKEERHRLPSLKHVVMMEGTQVDDPIAMTWEAFLARGEEVEDGVVDERVSALQPDQLATFIYTSGTTGPPKAVMLTHENLAWTANLGAQLVDLTSEDTGLSYLPLSHIAEQIFTIHSPISVGSIVYFAESLVRLPDNLKSVQPTVFFGVPRVWEKFYSGITTKLAAAEGTKAKLAGWALGVGRACTTLENEGMAPTGLLALQHRLAKKLVLSKVRLAIGLGNADKCITGAAPISKEILEFFAGLGISIKEVYGQSEDTGPTTFNTPGATRYGTVGRRVPGVEVRIAEDGEICVKGPNVFKGYYKDQEATDEALQDGWLLSGDLGEFDEDGYLRITGRKKDILITAGGKNIAPKNLELSLTNLPLVGQAVVIGDRRKFLSALLTLDETGAAAFAASNGISVSELSTHGDCIAEIQKGVDSVNSQYARVEHIRKFTVLPAQFSMEAGELTPTMKIKRRIVNENYTAQIDAMYGESAPV
jgi:long-chain acyl-CoA synthetase